MSDEEIEVIRAARFVIGKTNLAIMNNVTFPFDLVLALEDLRLKLYTFDRSKRDG